MGGREKEKMRQILFFVIVLWASLSAVAQPTITQPPANQVVTLGGTLTLGVTVGGTTPAYQWFKDSRLILGATNSALTVTNAGVTNSGTYYVVVTNAGGMVISLPALVTVGNPSLLAWGYNSEGQLGNGTTSDAHTPITVMSNVVAGAAGGGHSMFVKADGTLWAMGYNNYGQLGNGTTNEANTPINVASNVVAVAAGCLYSLFVKTDGTLWGMGNNSRGQLGNGTNNFDPNPTPVSVASNVVAIAAGQWHSLFVTTDGTLWAMGENDGGQLGNGSTINTDLPVKVAGNVVAVAAGFGHSLFVTADGTLWAMGLNNYGQLGNGATSNTNQPVVVTGNVVAVAAGYEHSLFVTADGTLWAMGWNNYGQLGNGTTSGNNANPTPINVASNVVAVAAGYEHSLFVTADGTLWTMGYNVVGELGNGTTSSTSVPVCVTSLSLANIFPADQANHSLALGINHHATVTLGNLNQNYTGSAIRVTAVTIPSGLTVNLTYNGSPNAPTNAGSYTVIGTINDPNYYGSAMNTLFITPAGPTNQEMALGAALTLTALAGNTGVAYQWFKDSRLIVGATNSTLTVTNAGVTNSGTYYVVVTNAGGMVISLPALVTVGNPSLLAWGWNAFGQLGNGTRSEANTPINVASHVVAGTAGLDYSLFVTADGTLWGIGNNAYGELGIAMPDDAYTPVIVASNVVAVAAGSGHSLFVTADGTLWGMGDNTWGELGNGTANIIDDRVSVASNVMAVAAGYGHSLFVKTDGTLWAMGFNYDGQLGNGTTSDAHTPINVASNVVAVAAGGNHSLFVTADGTLWVMGDNAFGQLGNGTTNDVLTPISVASNVVAVAAGGGHSLFVTVDGTLWTMGQNNDGQLGNGTTNNTNRPVIVASNVVAVAAGYEYSLFTKTDGTLWAIGYNGYGELGNGTTSNTSLPVSVPHVSVANVFPADQAYHSLAIGFIKTLATVMLGNLNQLYTVKAISVMASTTPPGLTVNLTYNGSPNAPTNPGSYTVIGTVNDPNYYGSATNTLVINPNATVTLGNLNQIYTGSAISVTVSTTPPRLPLNLTYNGSSNAPTNPGSYTVVGIISDPNYYGNATNTLVVGLPPQSFIAGSTSSTNSQQLMLQLTGTPYYPYILQSATNLTPPIVWQCVCTNCADANGNCSFIVTNLSGIPAGFFRAVAQ
jgi:alpha-tubulin suppressor-like RCC1 family protein